MAAGTGSIARSNDRDANDPATASTRNVSRYDLVLATIPTAFLVALLVAQFLPLSTHTALVSASLIGALMIVDGLFRNPPRSGHDG